MTRRFLSVLAACYVALFLSSCSAANGPVKMGGDNGELCVPVQESHDVLIGDTISSSAPVNIESVTLEDATGIKVVDSYLLETSADAIGSAEYPPVGNPAWASRVNAVGATLQPNTGYNVVLQVRRTTEEGRASKMLLTYNSGGQEVTAHGTTSIVLVADCQQ